MVVLGQALQLANQVHTPCCLRVRSIAGRLVVGGFAISGAAV